MPKYLCASLIILFFFDRAVLQAQQISVKGKVYDEKNIALQNVLVKAYDLQDTLKLLSHTFTNDGGYFEINVAQLPILLKITSLDFETFKKRVAVTEFLSIKLSVKIVDLDEILVKANKNFASISNDTINYNLDILNLKEDDNLKTILERIPGFSVDKNSKIKHNGEEINKLLINGREVFIYQNSIALENIENKMLKGISVISNYKDPFKISLAKENDEKVIDLKIKDNFKHLLKGSVDVGLGAVRKYKLKPFLYYFSEKLSIFSSSSANNILDKNISNQEYSDSRRLFNVNSKYFSENHNNLFFDRDITLNKENTLYNSSTVRWSTDKFSLQAVVNANALSANRLKSEWMRIYNTPTFSKSIQSDMAKYFGSISHIFRYKISPHSVLSNTTSAYTDRHTGQNQEEATFYTDGSTYAVKEDPLGKTQVFSNKVNYETAISTKLIAEIYWSLIKEKSTDKWQLLLGNPPNPLATNIQQIIFKGTEHKLKGVIRQKVGKNDVINYYLGYDNERNILNNENIVQNINQKKNRYYAGAALNIGYNWVDLSADVNLNILKISVNGDDYKDNFFPQTDFRFIFYLDALKKNKISLRNYYLSAVPDIKTALAYNVENSSQVVRGDLDLIKQLYFINNTEVVYHYLFPFKGQSFSLGLNKNYSSNAFIQTINTDQVFERRYQKVKGANRWKFFTSYGQYILTDVYPLEGNVTLSYFKGHSHQISGKNTIEILNKGYDLESRITSFSNYRFNFGLYGQYNHGIYSYSNAPQNLQKTLSVYAELRFLIHKNLTTLVKPKYTQSSSGAVLTSFKDMDITFKYNVSKKLNAILSGENVFHSLSLNKNGQLPLIDNANGVEYYSVYRNVIGYVMLGIQYKL